MNYNLLIEKFSKQVQVFSDSWYSTEQRDRWEHLFVVFEFEIYFKRSYSITNARPFSPHILRKEYNRIKKLLSDFLLKDMWLSAARIKVFDSYHSAIKNKTHWYLEPDSSLNDQCPNDYVPVEIVTPWLSGERGLFWLEQIQKFAKQHQGITHSSTGCHINIRYKKDPKTFDWLKLLILSQDIMDLYRFARQDNSYAVGTLKDLLKSSDQLIHTDSLSQQTLDAFKKELASIFHPRKYHAVNMEKFRNDRFGAKHGFVEFRAPGNDYFGSDFPQLKQTLVKYLNLMGIATTNQYETEYQLRLIRLFNRLKDKTPVLLPSNKKRLINTRNAKELEKYLSEEEMESLGFVKVDRLSGMENSQWVDLHASKRPIMVSYIDMSFRNRITEFPVWAKRLRVGRMIAHSCLLKSLKNIPPRIGELTLSRLSITSLKGLKTVIELTVNDCQDLHDLTGMPKRIKYLKLSNLTLNDLKGIAIEIETLDINNIKNLESFAELGKSNVRTINLSNIDSVKNFVGMPEKLDQLTIENCTGIESLEGFPREIRFFKADSAFFDKFPKKELLKVCSLDRVIKTDW